VRIVVVTIEPPDPFGNAASRWFYVLFRGLVARGHDVTMLSSCSDATSRARAEELFQRPDYDLRCFPIEAEGFFASKLHSAREPFSYVFSKAMRAELNRLLDQGLDVLHLEQLWCGWLGWRVPDKCLLNVHYLFSADWQGSEPSGIYDRMRRQLTFHAERRILRRYSQVTTLTDRLARDIAVLTGKAAPSVVPLGIDPSLYEFVDSDPPGAPTVGLIGNFSWHPTYLSGIRLVEKLWPRVKERVPTPSSC